MRLSEILRTDRVAAFQAAILDWADKVEQLEEALTEQLDKRGYAFRGRCDGVPDDIRRAFLALGTPCNEVDKKALAKKKESDDDR